MFQTGQIGSSANDPYLYSRDPRFEFRQGHPTIMTEISRDFPQFPLENVGMAI
jgi:hypothetical protein